MNAATMARIGLIQATCSFHSMPDSCQPLVASSANNCDRQRRAAGLWRHRGAGVAGAGAHRVAGGVLVGATAGGRLASSLVGPVNADVPAPVRRRWVTITLLLELELELELELGLVAVAGVVALGLPVGGGGARRYVVIALLAAALGCRTRPCAAWRSPMSPRPYSR
jgi:hypothetical protein